MSSPRTFGVATTVMPIAPRKTSQIRRFTIRTPLYTISCGGVAVGAARRPVARFRPGLLGRFAPPGLDRDKSRAFCGGHFVPESTSDNIRESSPINLGRSPRGRTAHLSPRRRLTELSGSLTSRHRLDAWPCHPLIIRDPRALVRRLTGANSCVLAHIELIDRVNLPDTTTGWTSGFARLTGMVRIVIEQLAAKANWIRDRRFHVQLCPG